VISTKYGLAMLVVPSCDITISDYTSTFASSTATRALTSSDDGASSRRSELASDAMATTTTRFKHWLKSEDELLHYAITKQVNGPPYMWQQIAQTYFPNTRNANQVRNKNKRLFFFDIRMSLISSNVVFVDQNVPLV
jgi:hypothetical protein